MSLMNNLLPRISNGHRKEMQKSLTEKLANNVLNDYNNIPDTEQKEHVETDDTFWMPCC
jgi:hypothetical protein